MRASSVVKRQIVLVLAWFKGIPPYQETQHYVKKIIRLYWQMLPEGERKGWSPD